LFVLDDKMAKNSEIGRMAIVLRKKGRRRYVQVDDDEREIRQLVAEIKRGNKNAFTELVHHYQTQVAALAFKVVNNYDEASDIAQDVFMKVGRNIWRYDEQKKFSTWLYRITMNASIDYMRKHRRHRHEPLEGIHDTVESVQTNPELSFRRQQVSGYIKEATESLNAKQRSAFVLRDVEGCKIDDVADMMDMPEATVRWYLHRARAKIRRELTRRCPHLLLLLGIR
jgi:RNA polymerase sigma-70 factor (ECF subfamily)